MATPNTDPTPNLESIPGISEVSEIDPNSVNALDAAFREIGGNPSKPEDALAVVEKVEPKVKETPKPKADEAPPVKETPGTDDVLDDAISRAIEDEKKEKAEKEKPVVKETPAAPVAEKDELDAVELPPNVKPKTVESFTQLKDAARVRIAAVSKERDALTKQVEELKANVGVPKEVEAELKSLREFRAKLDVEADPAFTSFDKTVAENTEAIYARLAATPGIDTKTVDAIKALGGPAEVDWDAPNIKLPAALRRFIDAKLVENEGIADKKTKAIADAKSNAEQYLSTRRDEQSKGTETQNKAVETEIDALLPKFPWFKELKAKDGASAEDKTAIDAHNKLVVDAKATLTDAINDNSPAMRAILAVGYAQLLKTRSDFTAFKATAAAKEKQLTTDLEAANALIAKVKKSSTTRLRDTAAEEDGGSIKAAKVDASTPGTEALDKHLAAIQAAKE